MSEGEQTVETPGTPSAVQETASGQPDKPTVQNYTVKQRIQMAQAVAQDKAKRDAKRDQSKTQIKMETPEDREIREAARGTSVKFDPALLQQDEVVAQEFLTTDLPMWTAPYISGETGIKYAFRWPNQHDVNMVLARRTKGGLPEWYKVNSDSPFWDEIPVEERDPHGRGCLTKKVGSGIEKFLVFTLDSLAVSRANKAMEKSRAKIEARKQPVGGDPNDPTVVRPASQPDPGGKSVDLSESRDPSMVRELDPDSSVQNEVALVRDGEVQTSSLSEVEALV